MASSRWFTSAVVGLVLFVGGLALVDSLRGCSTSGTEATPAPTSTTTPTTTAADGLVPQGEAPEGWPQGELSGVLTFVDEEICQLRAIGLAGGRERPLPDYELGCGERVWAPKVGGRVAFRVRGTAFDENFRFTIRDVGYGDRDFGTYDAYRRIVWSPDAQRIAWCTSSRRGAEREILGGKRRLPFCPIAYTPQGNLARADGRRLLVGSTVLLRAGGRIIDAQFGSDGAVVVLTSEGTLERYAPGVPPFVANLPTSWTAQTPSEISPDGCAAAVPLETGVALVSLGCLAGPEREYSGTTAEWSPDGAWLAVADGDAIAFHSMTSAASFVWPARATQLVWRTS